MVKLFCISATALALAVCASIPTAPAVDARITPWHLTQDVGNPIPRHLQTNITQSDVTSLDAKLEAYIREGRFPKAGRSLKEKIREANAFLERETSSGAAGPGIAATVVYKDKVVLNKGYGLRNVSDSTSRVTPSTLFQIGSVTKTFVGLAIAVLIDEGKVAWHDPVIKHLPTFKLFDKYAEQHVTIGDMLAMNSGLGIPQNIGWMLGMYPTDKEFVAALGDAQPEHSLRSEYDYANANFAILGQLIERVSGLEWDAFMQQRIWAPLGMNRTFGDSAAALNETDKSAAHYACGKDVLGPYDLVSSPEALLVTGTPGWKSAAGSMMSSADDMTKFMRLMLNKGSVDGVKILRAPNLVTEMTSGKSVLSDELTEIFSMSGYQFVPDGNTLAGGYGLDAVGHVLWGHACFTKSGDTNAHTTRTAFIPDDEQLGVLLMANSQFATTGQGLHIDHMRSYITGIFLDVPTKLLKLSLQKWTDAVPAPPALPGIPACGERFWKNPSILPLNASVVRAIAGEYVPKHSPKFFGSLNVTATSANGLTMNQGKLVGKMQLVLDTPDSKVFLLVDPAGQSLVTAPIGQSLVTFTKDGATGKYSTRSVFRLDFQQQ